VNGAVRIGALRVLLGVVVAVALGGVATGGYLIVADLSERGEMFDGLGAVIGAMVLAGSVLAGVLAVVAAVLAVRRPMVARVIGVLLALAALALAYPPAVDTDWGVWLVPFPLLLLVVAVLPDGSAR
jgi:hypothetical protein